MSRKLWLLALVLLLPIALVAAKDTPAAKVEAVLKVTGQPVKTDTGLVRGLVVGASDDMHVYRGIPFAAPPVGELRWRAPQPAKAWSGVRECYEFGAAAPQKSNPMLATFPGMMIGAPTSEDCLFLNVWTPAKPAKKPLPVMVWIHGGGYTMGAASQRLYEATDLARRGAVVVSVNYRLGALGFLAHPQLSAESEHGASGNYGLLDQIEALRWVQRNIAAFGGDANRVTIFGESAGGGSVFALMCSPLAKGLFHRAIAESGPTLYYANLKKKSPFGFSPAEEMGLELAKKWGAPEGAGQIAAMRALSADDIVKASPSLEDGGGGDFSFRRNQLSMAPIVDGHAITDDPMTLFASGKQHAVPLIVGANRDEGSMFMLMVKLPKGQKEWQAALAQNFGDKASMFGELYPPAGPNDIRAAITDLVGDFMFVAPARFVARSMKQTSSPTYMYHFAHPPAGPTGKMLGAHHGAELVYVFDNLELARDPSAVDKSLSDTLAAYWVQFAATGNPNRDGLPNWPAHDVANDQCLMIEDTPAATTNLRKPKLDAIDALLDEWRSENGAK